MDNARDRPSAETYQTRQPVGANYNQPIGDPWSTGLFDCHLDQTNATMTAFLPCVTFGQISEVMDEGELTCPLGSLIYALMMPALCSQWLMGSKYRTKMRGRYNLVEAPYSDIISHVFCLCCSLCQEFRELEARGLDPALGWNGILAQKQAGGATVDVPPTRDVLRAVHVKSRLKSLRSWTRWAEEGEIRSRVDDTKEQSWCTSLIKNYKNLNRTKEKGKTHPKS